MKGEANTRSGESVLLEFAGVDLRFGAGRALALRDVSFGVPEGKFVSIIGPSGCGKSTLLNLAAGLLRPSRGSVNFRGRPVGSINTHAAYVTQEANLLPWLTVEQNIGLALKLRRTEAGERARRTAQWIEMVGLCSFEKYFPRELSGGMQKRCSIARSLIYEPDLVLMDEPFGPLDAMTRQTLQQHLLNLWEPTGRTAVFVTHDISEAVFLSDLVVVMSKGPGSIKAVIPVPIPRPRRIVEILESAEYGRTIGNVWDALEGGDG
jgi:NitT/TauT family transport system ATP-binding protein